jgi:pSer/pThr/pTyr-binding forkhead associated (FHA) protein
MVYTPEADPEPAPAEAQPAETVTLTWDGGRIELNSRIVVIGRSSECDISLSDPNVSRRHAEIRRIGDGFSLVDLDSTNGTEVNGQRVEETTLMSGDVISVGTTPITFERHVG